MANVAKLVDIILGANPSEDDLWELVARINERLPKPAVERVPEPAPVDDEPTEQETQPKSRRGK